KPLPLRRSTQEHRARPHGEIGAARQDGVGRGYADQVPGRDLKTLVLEEACILGNKMRREGERQSRDGKCHLGWLLALPDAGREPNSEPKTTENEVQCPFEHPFLPNYRSCLRSLKQESSERYNAPAEAMATPLDIPSPSAVRQAPIAASRRARSDHVLV